VSRRLVLLGGSAAALPTLAACVGGFNMTGVVYDWNRSHNKWVNWLIFLAFIILPVYGITLFIDALIINSIEFWSGDNPIQRAASRDMGNGERLVVTPTIDRETLRVEHYRDEQLVKKFHVRRVARKEIELQDAVGNVLARVRIKGSMSRPSAELLDAHGNALAHLTDTQVAEAAARTEQGESPAQAVMDAVAANGELAHLSDWGRVRI
jgi:hypothetical protein